jgi:hypothetical protein
MGRRALQATVPGNEHKGSQVIDAHRYTAMLSSPQYSKTEYKNPAGESLARLPFLTVGISPPVS